MNGKQSQPNEDERLFKKNYALACLNEFSPLMHLWLSIVSTEYCENIFVWDSSIHILTLFSY